MAGLVADFRRQHVVISPHHSANALVDDAVPGGARLFWLGRFCRAVQSPAATTAGSLVRG
jgi:hypothetical protein